MTTELESEPTERRFRRARGDRGVALLEFAMVLPFLIVLVTGVLEFGSAFRDSMTVSNSLRSGVRVASNSGDDRLTDYGTIKALEAAIRDVPDSKINRIVIFDAGTVNEPPAACKSGSSVADVCNVYTPSDFARPQSDFEALNPSDPNQCASGAPDAAWCPLERSTDQATGTDRVGVWVEVFLPYRTGLFPGSGLTVTDSVVMRLEPEIQ